jgi:hypothetical protein
MRTNYSKSSIKPNKNFCLASFIFCAALFPLSAVCQTSIDDDHKISKANENSDVTSEEKQELARPSQPASPDSPTEKRSGPHSVRNNLNALVSHKALKNVGR